MAVKTKHIRTQKYTLPPIKYGNDDLNVSFYKNKYTPRLQAAASIGNETPSDTMMTILLPILAEWDLYNDYEVYHYNQYTDQTIDIGNLKSNKLFVINGRDGKLGEYEEFITREEFINEDNTEKQSVIYHLEPLFDEGEQVIEERIVPITEQGMLDVPNQTMTDILIAIGEFVSPGEARSSNSDSSFS